MISIDVYDNPKLFERYAIIVRNPSNPDNDYCITIAEDPDSHTYLHPIDEAGANLGRKTALSDLPLEQQRVVFAFLADDIANGRIEGKDIPSGILGSVFSIVSSDRYPPLGGMPSIP